jgi:mevalonate kinase
MDNRKYNGKVILFGEYSMIFGSNALLIPYYSVSGEWSTIISRPCERGIESNRNLFKYYDYLRKDDRFRILDLERMEMELNAGLFFDSNIPTGYGVGSSGALVAAIYDRFKLIEIKETDRLIEFLAAMENYFHGSSSGIDPLQCYFGKPFVLNGQRTTDNGQQILSNDFMSDDIHIFLIDTKITSPTAPLVNIFKERRKDNIYLDKFNNRYVPLVNDCISSLIEKKDDDFFNNVSQLSKMQTEMLGHTIPDNVKEFFFFDINKDGFQIKLCGAGGGGFLLGFTNNIEKTNQYWQNTEYQIHWVK